MRIIPLLTLFLPASLGCRCLQAQAQAPNLLIVVGDDMGLDTLRSFGTPTAPPTPTLDAIAGAGMRFTNFIANPACSPTRGSLLTGRYGIHNGVTTTLGGNDPGLDTGETTFAAALAATPYSRALVGKWHIGLPAGAMTPNTFGFQHFAGILDAGVPDYYNWVEVVDGQAVPVTRYATTELVDQALAWIGAQSGPWMLELAFNAPHLPFQAPPRNLYSGDLSGLDPQTNPAPFQAAMIEAMDRELGRLLLTLPPATVANTNIVFLGDNGTDGAVVHPPVSPLRVKGSLYDRGAHVPLIVSGPAVQAHGAVCDALVSVVDLFPTVLALCGAPLPPSVATRPLDGVSMMPLITGAAPSIRDNVYVDMSVSFAGGGYAVRDRRHELLRIQSVLPSHMEMYDLQNDPYETNNLLLAPLGTQEQSVFDHFMTVLDGIRPDGWNEEFGNGCPGSAGVPDMRAQTEPTVGRTFTFQLANCAPTTLLRLAVVGLSNRVAGGSPLPFALDSLGMPGCRLLVSINGSPSCGPDGYGVIRIPNATVYNGASIYMQGFALEPGVNAGGMISSNGLHCIVGM